VTGTQSAYVVRVTLVAAVSLVAALLTAAAGCSSGGAGEGAADGSVSKADTQTDARICTDPNILASNYDQSCANDLDCVAIAEGNPCAPCAFACFNSAAISASAMPKYTSDIANTPAVLAAADGGCAPGRDGGCPIGGGILPANWGPFCCGGTCHVGSFCDGGLSCRLGGGCSPTLACDGVIDGCSSNCQCLDGTWQAPCPAEVPQSGSACTAGGATCGYLTSAVACDGSVDCYCQGGAWSCAPTCIIAIEDASTDAADAGAEADAADAGGGDAGPSDAPAGG
jgi:hypothetical protein